MSEPVQPTPITSRRKAREAAFQALYACTVGQQSSDQVLGSLSDTTQFEMPAWELVCELVEVTLEKRSDWDELISGKLTSTWTLERIALTDRLALQMALTELYEMPAMPPKVTITEYVGLAKKYGNAESGRFVNGVLGALLNDSPKAQWDPSQVSELEEEPSEPEPETQNELEPEAAPTTGAWVIKSD